MPMLLVCPDCSHRYRIPTEGRAPGRTVRFACRKCGAGIDSTLHTAEETLAEGPGWLVINDGEATGPYDNRTLVSLARAGRFGARALVWRDGFEDWRVAGCTPPLGPDKSVAWWVRIDDAEVQPIVQGLVQVLRERPEHEATHKALERLVRIGRSMSALASLEAVMTRRGETARLVELLEDRLTVTDDADDRRAMRRRLGSLYEALEQPRAALAAYDDVLRDGAPDDALVQSIVRAAEALDDAEELARRLSTLIDVVEPQQATPLRLALARVRAERLDAPDAALEALDTVETHVEGPEARALRIELYIRLQRWPALAALYAEIAAETTDAEQRAARHGLADVLIDRLDDVAAAADVLVGLVNEDPTDDRAVERLAAIVGQHPDLTDVADVLDGALVARDDWGGVYALRAGRIDRIAAGSARASAMAALAALCVERLANGSLAFEWAARAAVERPYAEDYRRLHRELAQISDRLPAWVDHAVKAVTADAALADVYLEAAAELPLLEFDAERLYRSILRSTPASEAAYAALAGLLADRPGELRSVIDSRLERVEASARRPLLVKRAALEVGPLRDPAAAWSTWDEILTVDPSDAEALEARYGVAALLDAAHRLQAADALAVHVDGDDARALELRRESARIVTEQDPVDAIARWWTILAAAPADAEATAALAELCEREGDLAGLTRLIEGQRHTGDAELDRQRRLAQLYAAQGDGRAAACWRAVLDVEPTDAEALDGLEAAVQGQADGELEVGVLRLAAADDKGEALAGLVEIATAAAGDRAGLVFAAAALVRTGDDPRFGPIVEAGLEDGLLPLVLDAWAEAADAAPSAALCRRRARWAGAAGRVDEARADLRRLVELEPDDLDAWRARLDLAESAADWPEVVECLTRLQDAADDDDAARRALARRRAVVLAEALDAPDAAIDAWAEARSPVPTEDAEVLDALIALLEQTGRTDALVDALVERETYARMDGDRATCVASAERRAGIAEARGATDDALEARWAALDAGAEAAETLARIDRLLVDADRPAQRPMVLRRRIAVETGAAQRALRAERAKLLVELRDADGALAEWDAILADAPGDVPALEAARALRVERGDWTEAVQHGDRLLAVMDADDPRSLELARNQAEALSGPLDDAERAVDAWSLVLRRSPDDDAAADALEALYRRLDRPAGLLAMLERRAARAEDVPAALHCQIGDLRRRLDDDDGALAAYDAALATDAASAEAFQKAIAVLDVRGDDAGALARIERHAPHVSADRAEALHADAAERAARVDRPDVAVVHLSAAMRAGGDDARFGPPIEEHAASPASWQLAATTWRAVLADLAGTSASLSIELRLLAWSRGPLNDTEGALRHAAGVLALDPTHPAALEARVDLSAEPALVADALARLHDRSADPAARAEQARRLGALYAGPLADAARAGQWFETSLTDAPDDRDALAGLAEVHRATGAWAPLRAIRLRQAALARNDARRGDASEDRAALLAEAARLSVQLGAPGQALADWIEVLAVDPHHEEALVAARALQRETGDRDAVVALGARLLDLWPADHTERLDLLRDQARLIDRTGHTREAIAAWRALSAAVPADAEALAALDRLFTATDSTLELAETLAARVGVDGEDPVLWRRLGDARRALGDLEVARIAFEQTLTLDPADGHAFEAAVALAETPIAAYDLITAFLPHAPSAVHGALHARALEAAVEAEQFEVAVGHLAVCVEETSDDVRFGAVAERIGARTGDWSALHQAWMRAIARCTRRADALPLHRRAARWCVRHLDDIDAARPHAEAVLVADPDDVEALEMLGRASDPAVRVDALARLHPMADTSDERADQAAAIGAIYADELSDARAAVGWFEAALVDRADDARVLERLAQSHDALGDRFSLCRTRRRQAAVAEGAARIELRVEAARLATELRDPHAARDWATVLEDAPDHREALVAARRLEVERDDARAAMALGDRLLAVLDAEDPARPSLLREQARVADRLHRADRAIDLWRALLSVGAGDSEALDRLEALFGETDDPHGLLWVLEQRRAAADAPSALLLVRMGDVRRIDIGDERAALADYDAALEADPLSRVAFDRACAVCAALGDRGGEMDRIVARLERVEDAAERAVLHGRVADLAELLDQPRVALRHRVDAVRVSGDESRQVDAVERLAAETGDWALPAAGWRAALLDRPASVALPLRRRLLSWATGPLDDTAEARVHAEQILAIEPEDGPALRTLAELATRPAERADLLARLFDRIDDDARRVELALTLGSLHADDLDGPGRAVRWFEAALDLDPTDGRALDGVAAVHAGRGARAPLLAVRLRQANRVQGAERAAFLVEAAELAEGLGQPDAATEHWRRAVEAGADVDAAAEALDRLLTAQGRWAELATVLEERIERSPAADRRPLWVRLARLAQSRLADPARALACWRAVLVDSPDDDEALWAALELSDGAARTALRRRLVERLSADDPRRLDLRRTLAREAGPSAAARSWEAVLADAPADAEALDALETLYEQSADWPSLVRVLAARVGDPPADIGRLLRIARLRDEQLGDSRAAAAAYDTLVALDPGDGAAFARLVELRVGLGDHAGALARIEQRILAETGAPRVALHRQAARLAETHLGRPADALAHVTRAFTISRDDARFGPEVARLAVQAGDWQPAVQAWTGAIDAAEPAFAVDLHLRVGAWAAGPMADPALARQHYRAVLDIEPEHRQALRALATLAEDDPAHRVEALEGLLAAEPDPEARRELAVRLGDLYAGPLGRSDEAVARYHVALAAFPDDPEALDGLARVHAGRGAWAPLLSVRTRQVVRLDGAARAAMRVEMARLAERLDRIDDAVTHWQLAADEGADLDVALPALDALFTAHRRWRPLARLLERRVAHAVNDRPALRALHGRLAALYTERLDDGARAATHWEAVLDIEPRDADALWALRALAENPAGRVDATRRLLAALPADDAARGALQREVARLCADVLDRPAEAIDAWRAVLADHAGDAEALDALEALHGPADPAALVRVLELRHAAAPTTALRLRIGALREESGDGDGALADYRAVLETVPDHAEAFSRARRLLITRDEPARLLALLEARLAHIAEPAARRALADEAARVAEGRLDDADTAMRWMGEAFAACRDDAAYGDEMARLAELTGDWPTAVARWQTAADSVAGAPEAVALHLRLHAWLDDQAEAASQLAEAARIAPDDPRVLRAQAVDAEQGADHSALLRSLAALRRQTGTEATRVDLTRRIARLLAGPLDSPESALAEYTRLLTDRPDDQEAIARRCDLLRQLDRANELYAALGAQLAGQLDPARRRAVLEERAALAERQGWTDEAIDGWRAVLAETGAEAAWTALETLLAADGRLGDLEVLLADRAVRTGGPTGAIILTRAARAALDAGAPDDARAHYEAALDLDPDCAPALRALAAMHATAGDAAIQARLEARLAAGLPDDTPEAVERWRGLGRLCQGAVGDPAQAITAWQKVRAAVPDDEEALEALATLYAAVGDDAALADVLDARAGQIADRAERRDVHARVAELREGLGDTDGACAAWAEVFALDPTADEPFDILVRLHESRADWSALAALLLERAAACPGAERRVALRLRAAELLAERLNRPAEALDVRLAVFADDPDDALHGPAIADLAAAADGLEGRSGHGSAARAWARALDGRMPVEVAVPLRMRLAGWQAERLDAPEDAIAQYCAVLDRVPDHAEALARMEALRARVGDWAALADLLQQRVARADDEPERLAALRRLGRVQARQVEARQAAIATWRRVRRDVPDDAEAAEALVRLYRDTGKWPALVRLLEELPPTSARLREIARLCVRDLDDRERAIDALERARTVDPDDRDTADALVVAYRDAGRWSALSALYLDLARRRSPAERPDLFRAVARIAETHLDDADGAAEAWRALHRLDPADVDAVTALTAPERADARTRAGLYARHVAALPLEQAFEARQLLARVYADELDDPIRAIEALRPLADGPARRDARTLRQLADLYARTGDWRFCADIIDREVAALAEPADRAARLAEAARVRETRLRDAIGAFDRVADAWRATPDDATLADEAARLAEIIGRPRALADLLGEIEGRVRSVPMRGRVLATLARTAHALGEPERERAAWAALREAVDPDDREALDALVRLHGEREAWSALRVVLEHRVALDDRVDDMVALGEICADRLDRLGEAAGWFRRVLGRDPDDARALAGLVTIERARGAWPALYDALERLAAVLADDAQAEALAEQARLAADTLGRTDDARRLWTEVLELRGGDDREALRALDALLTADGQDGDLVAVLERRLAVTEAPTPLHVRLADLHRHAGRDAAALDHWRQALEVTEDCLPALWGIEAHSPDAAEVADARARLLARLPVDDARRVDLLKARAASTTDDAEAIAAWRAVRAEAPTDGDAITALAEAYERVGDAAALADLLAETGRDRPRAARLALAAGRTRTARRLYEQVLADEPGHPEATEALAEVHRSALRWPALLEVLQGRLRVANDADERHALWQRIADVQHRRLRQADVALDTLCEAFAERPDADLLERMHALAAECEGWPALADALEQADGDWHRWLAAIYADRLGMPQAAIAHARRAWRATPGDATLTRQLEESLTAVEDWDALADLWSERAELLERAERRDLLARLARLHADRRGEPTLATAVWRDILAADPTDAEALDALAFLARETDRIDEWCAVLERRFEQADEPAERRQLAEHIAELAAGPLNDAARAIGPMKIAAAEAIDGSLAEPLATLYDAAGRLDAALAVRVEAISRLADDRRPEALIALGDRLAAQGAPQPWRQMKGAHDVAADWFQVETRLDAVGRWAPLIEMAIVDAETAGGRDRWMRVARLHARAGDVRASRSTWLVALAAAPGDAEVLDALEALHRDTGRLDRHVALLEQQLARAAGTAIEAVARRLAVVRAELGDAERAAKAWSVALRARLVEYGMAGDRVAAIMGVTPDDSDAINDGISMTSGPVADAIDGIVDDLQAVDAIELLDQVAFAHLAAGHLDPAIDVGQWALRAAVDPAERAGRRLVLLDLADADVAWDAVVVAARDTVEWDHLRALLVDRPADEEALLRAAVPGGTLDDRVALARWLPGERSRPAWRAVVDAVPAHPEAHVRLTELDAEAGRPDSTIERLCALLDRPVDSAPTPADTVEALVDEDATRTWALETLAALVDPAAEPAASPAFTRLALEALHAADVDRGDIADRLAEARRLDGDHAGWQQLAGARRAAQSEPETWAERTVALLDGGVDFETLVADADDDRLDALEAALHAQPHRLVRLQQTRAVPEAGAERHARLARTLVATDRPVEAFAAWCAVLERRPVDAEALDAIDGLEDALSGDEVVAIYAAQLAHAEDDDALVLAERIVAHQPMDAPTLAVLYRVAEHTAELDLLDAVGALHAEAGRDADALRLAERALAVEPDLARRAQRASDMAGLRVAGGDLEGAFHVLCASLRLDPDRRDDDARLARLAEVLDRADDYAEALDAARVATGDAARRAELEANLLGLYEGALADSDRAEAFWRAVLTAAPADDAAYGALVRRLTTTERWLELAEVMAVRAHAVPSTAVELLTARARLLTERADAPTEAAAAWSDVLDADPVHDEALRARWGLEPDTDARDRLAAVLLRRTPVGDALRVELHRWLAERTDGAEHWQAVLAADPTDDVAAQRLEALRREAGDWDQVRALLDRRLTRAADRAAEAEIWRAIATVETQRGDGAATRAAWRAVLARRPGDPEAEEALAAASLALQDVEGWAELRLARLDHIADGAARLSLYREVADVLEARLPDAGPAFDVVARAFAERPHDGGLAGEMARLAESTGRIGALTDAWRTALERLDGRPALALALRLAEVEVRQDRMDAAADAWRRALTIDPRSVPALEGLEKHATARGDDEALAEVLAARLRTPLDDEAALSRWRRLARLHSAADRTEAADGAWTAVLQRSPDDVEALQALAELYTAGEAWRALSEVLMRQLAATDGPAEVELRHRLARLLAEQLDDRAAARAALEPVALQADDVELTATYAELGRAAEDWPEVVAALDRVARRTRGMRARDAWVDKAEIERTHLDAPQAAMASLEEAARLDPRHRPTLEAIWRLAEQLGDAPGTARALTRLEATAETPAERARWLTRLGELCDDALGDPAGAVAAWEQALAAEPQHGPALRRLTERALAERRWPEAAVLLERLLDAEPDADVPLRRDWRVAAARCAEALDDDDGARQHYESALELDNTHREALVALADLAFRQGDWARAFKVGHTLLIHHGDEMGSAERADRLHRLGALKALAGEPKQARAFYEQAVVAHPGHAPSARALGEAAAAEPQAVAVEDPSWIGETDLVDAEDAALDAYLYGDGPALEIVEDDDAEWVDDDEDAGRSTPPPLPAVAAEPKSDIRRTGAYASPMVQIQIAADARMQAAVEKAVEVPIEKAVDRIMSRFEAGPPTGQIELDALVERLEGEKGPSEAQFDALVQRLDARPGDARLDVIIDKLESRPDDDRFDRIMERLDSRPGDDRLDQIIERLDAGPDAAALDRIVERLGDGQLVATADDGAVVAAARAAESAAAEAAAAARAAEAAAAAANAGAEAMSAAAVPLAKLAEASTPGVGGVGPRVLGPVKPIKASKVRVVRRTKPRRERLMLVAAAAVLVAGVSLGGIVVANYQLDATEAENEQLAWVSQTLANRVKQTQGVLAQTTRELQGDPQDGTSAPETAVALFDESGQPLERAMLELAFRDLEMREQIGTVRSMMANLEGGKTDQAERSKALEAEVARLEARIAGLKDEQTEVHERLAGRLDQNISAVETALTATGIDFESLMVPDAPKTPMVVAGVDDTPMTGVGGPFMADGTSEYVNPVPGETEVMSGFGPRGHSHHNGIDIPAPIGTAVLAVTAGEVIHVQNRSTWQGRPKFIKRDGRRVKSSGWRAGIYVELRQDDGRISRYMHLGAVAPGIEVGAKVQKGQVLGSVGRTGVEHSETHLHFELREAPDSDDERFGAALDPAAELASDDGNSISGASLLHVDPGFADLSPDVARKVEARKDAPKGTSAVDAAVVAKLDTRMDRLAGLEKLLREMPLVPPVDDFRVSSRFGRRVDPINGDWGHHGGIDIPGAEGTAIRATAPGIVVFSGNRGRYGVMVEIDHGNGITTRYGHLLRSLVRKGQRVRYRDRIGEMGSSGRSTGTHLHYEVRVDGKPRDPMNFIQAGRYVFKR